LEATMIERRRMLALGWAMVLLAACGGGSGSTGLITSEGALLDQVRRDGTCAELDGAAFCATDSPHAIAPGGQRASVLVVTPTPLASPTAPPLASPTAQATNGGASPTPAPAITATPLSGPTASPSPSGGQTVSVVVDGFGPDAACAVAARTAGQDGGWRTGPLVEADGIVFPLPAGVAEPSEIVLLCFAPAPLALKPEIERLADATPTVVFVLPSP
jgi:hypothetical protein